MRQENNTNLFIDIFAGCGGLSLGLIRAGWKCAFAIEKNCDAFSTYKHNLLDGKYATSFDWPIWLERTAHDIDELLESHRKDLLALRGKVELIAGGASMPGFLICWQTTARRPQEQAF
ncbi:DNA cytosine methyltransferase [Methylocaldum marinum]|uniref:DNA cytosine methyltransferase n=1 Tax=Methylocaldum marinum TaxID=1432792 RepID=UPI000E6A665C|nr:DNA cytosine methyltransferase [Methylocaldum marinum]